MTCRISADRGLLLERLLGLVEEAHVLDRDHRLVGEGPEQRDLLVGERPDFRPTIPMAPSAVPPSSSGAASRSDARSAVAGFRPPGSRHSESAARSSTLDRSPLAAPRDRSPSPRRSGTVRSGPKAWPTGPVRYAAEAHGAARGPDDDDVGRVAKPETLFADRVEHRRDVGRRARMTCRISAVAVCCSSASVSSRFCACNSLNSRAFSIAITAWSAKVLSSAISFSENSPTAARPTKIDADAASLPQHRREDDRLWSLMPCSRAGRTRARLGSVVDVGVVHRRGAAGSPCRTRTPRSSGTGKCSQLLAAGTV